MKISEIERMHYLCGQFANILRTAKSRKLDNWDIDTASLANRFDQLKSERVEVDSLNTKLQAMSKISDIEEEVTEIIEAPPV